MHPDSIHICAVVVTYETTSGRINHGVATNWLKTKSPPAGCDRINMPRVPIYVRK